MVCAQRLLAPKLCLEMLRSLDCRHRITDGEALPPRLRLLSDQQEECQHCFYGHFSFPSTVSCPGFWGLAPWAYLALGQWAGIGSQGPAPGHQTDFNDFERYREEIGPDPFCYALCSLLDANSPSLGGEWYRFWSQSAWAPMPALPLASYVTVDKPLNLSVP